MNFSSPVRVRIDQDVVVRIYRQLKGKGTINVAEGQEVSPSDIIGVSNISSGFRILNLAKLLNVPPTDVQKYLKIALGQRIYKEELLAHKDSFLGGKKFVVSPMDGVLDFLNPKTGEVRLTFLPKKDNLPAGVYGIVEMVDKSRGIVVIKTKATTVHGMFGSGKVRDGNLHIVSRRDELVGASFISPKYDGQILVGGSLIFKDAITSAISSGVSGIISGGINAKDYKGMAGGRLTFPKKLENDIGISIVVCEGFGSIPIGEDIYGMLLKYNDKFVSIDGNAGTVILPSFESRVIGIVKKTQLSPLSSPLPILDIHEEKIMELKIGQRIRVIGSSYVGEQGKIVSLDKTGTMLASGIKTFLATIVTRRRKIQVPVANCEILDYSS